MNIFGLGQSPVIEIELTDYDTRKKHQKVSSRFDDSSTKQELPIFYDGENINGVVKIQMKRGSKLDHQGIKIEFLGFIEFHGDRANKDEFQCISMDLARPGVLSQSITYPFEFLRVDKPYESYVGSIVGLRYVLRLTVVKRLMNLVKEQEIFVHTLASYSDFDSSIKMEVGIEDSLHIEFEYNKSKYHLQDVIIGKIYFLLVRVKIKNMEVQILKREMTGFGVSAASETETIAKFEIMDGAPVRGESIPIRLFLGQYDLSPTMSDVNRKFSVRYMLNLVLLDEEERRYYKHQEIILYRKCDKRRLIKPVLANKPNSNSCLSSNNNDEATTTTEDDKVTPVETTEDDEDSVTRAARSMHRFESLNPPQMEDCQETTTTNDEDPEEP